MDDELETRVLAAELRRQIRDGVRAPGDRLPTEQAMARVHGIPVGTVRRAVDGLAAEGLVVRRHGAGAFVREAGTVGPAGPPSRRAVIGVIVPDTTVHFPRVLQGIEEVRGTAGARVEQVCSHYDPSIEARALRDMVAAGVDGVLVVPTLADGEDDFLRRIAALPVPVVVIERRGPSAAGTNELVGTHHEAGGYDAVRHLVGDKTKVGAETETEPIRSGVGYIGSAGEASALVAAGYRQAVAELDLPAVELDPAPADQSLARLLAADCTAALCFGAQQASDLMAAAARAGLAIPGDFAILAYEDELEGPADKPLSSVSPPSTELGRIAAELLLARLRHPERARRQVVLRPEIVVRGSCGAAP